ncbi:hypothetical protein [Sphingomonas oryzagri]|uniref:Restriction alleviation protein Lar n=1 Tax=Sphingomonas oryzagri TaxID=3042314 RepID=A0ABT6N628_9SPHN|nr:hypothetical protein [Sphingomonas oryzagri]MDH7640553.1 hypothetical protein [Sphingomonas oryzagri]
MTYPLIKPCLGCGDLSGVLYGYGDFGPLNWHVECDGCDYMGPAGNKLQAIRQHNQRVDNRVDTIIANLTGAQRSWMTERAKVYGGRVAILPPSNTYRRLFALCLVTPGGDATPLGLLVRKRLFAQIAKHQ